LALDGSIAVVAGLPTSPTNLSFSMLGGGTQLRLSWPAAYTGWLLQSNAANLANTTSWFTIPGSDLTNAFTGAIDLTRTNIFYRLVHP
jgi:hypothetical protein